MNHTLPRITALLLAGFLVQAPLHAADAKPAAKQAPAKKQPQAKQQRTPTAEADLDAVAE